MIRLKTLARHARTDLTDLLHGASLDADLTNVFNPSLAEHAGVALIAFRAESYAGERPFRSYVAIFGDGNTRLIDLTAANFEYGVTRVADPKLVTLDGCVYATFNTGYTHTGENQIYIQQVFPNVLSPQRCVYDGRMRIEKNWGFLQTTAGELKALYSLMPLNLLSHVAGELGGQDDLHFRSRTFSHLPARFPRVHIGSQPQPIGHNRFVVAANQQIPLRGLRKKLYVGRVAELDIHPSALLTRISPVRLIHSYRDSLPGRPRHNPNLISATYFSGLEAREGSYLLSYGINDLRFGIAEVPTTHAWTS